MKLQFFLFIYFSTSFGFTTFLMGYYVKWSLMTSPYHDVMVTTFKASDGVGVKI